MHIHDIAYCAGQKRHELAAVASSNAAFDEVVKLARELIAYANLIEAHNKAHAAIKAAIHEVEL